MLWFDGQSESQSVCVAGANERAAQLFGAGSAAALRGIPLQGLFAPRSWSELEGELARGADAAPRTLALELRAQGGRCVRARARLLDCTPALLLLEEQDAVPASALVCARMADGLLHDLRSPLMAVSGFAEVLGLRHAAELGDDARRCVDNIVAAARRLEEQTELLASYSRLGAGDLRLRPLDLRILLQRLGAENSDAPVELQLEPGLPLVAGDAGVLRVALAALLQGALLLCARRERRAGRERVRSGARALRARAARGQPGVRAARLAAPAGARIAGPGGVLKGGGAA
jgi:signal transduction histidine kinase